VKVLRKLALCAAAAGLVVTSGCAGAGSLGASANEVTIALVSNSQMTDAQKLSSEFEKANPGTKLKFIWLSENQARAKITMSTAMGGSEFDVVMISNFETPQWAKDGWLLNLSDSPGIAATALICVIFAWNEFFFAVNLTAVNAQTMPVYLVGFIAGEGQYWAVLSAAATMAALPVILCGWFAQNKLVRGLSFGAIK
jgi:hypothetical protein